MKLKPMTIGLLAAVLLAFSAAPALAEEPTPSTTAIKPSPSAATAEGSTNLEAIVDSDYTVTIPESINFGKVTKTTPENDRTRMLTVQTSNVIIPAGRQLNVTVKGTGASDAFTVTTGSAPNAQSLAYKVADTAKSYSPGDTILSAEADAAKEISVVLDTPSSAGTYTGQLVFTCGLAVNQ